MRQDSGRPTAVLIAGPTASGKSALALAIATHLGGVIVNADSCQIYRELRVLSARPSVQEEALVPHRLYGHRTAAAATSVAEWLDDVADVLKSLKVEGRLPVIVGGTGLYFRALTEGIAEVPEIPAAIRTKWRARALADGPEALHAELLARDPVMAARLRPTDTQRIARALEVIEATGRSLAEWQQAPHSPPLVNPAAALRLVIAPERPWLHRRIDRRFEAMIADGAIEEARALAAMGLSEALPATRAIGVRPLMDLAKGDLDLAAAIARGQAESRQYAKRQETWFRHQMPDWQRVDPVGQDADGLAQALIAQACQD